MSCDCVSISVTDDDVTGLTTVVVILSLKGHTGSGRDVLVNIEIAVDHIDTDVARSRYSGDGVVFFQSIGLTDYQTVGSDVHIVDIRSTSDCSSRQIGSFDVESAGSGVVGDAVSIENHGGRIDRRRSRAVVVQNIS